MTIENLTTKGTRILIGEEAEKKQEIIRILEEHIKRHEFKRIILPVLQFQKTYLGKLSKENNHMMYNFKDLGDRDLCLAPEYTTVIQKLATTTFKYEKNVKLFYTQQCFRAEKPQAGRYREFTQFGVEILNPEPDYNETSWYDWYMGVAEAGIRSVIYEDYKHHDNIYGALIDNNLIVNKLATRGLDYYKEGKDFEISWNALGTQKQICGGGAYENGFGWAIGVDRLMLI